MSVGGDGTEPCCGYSRGVARAVYPGRVLRVFGEGEEHAGRGGEKKVKLETLLIFNQQFLTLIRAGLPILGSLELLANGRSCRSFARNWRTLRRG